jgi:hypothetical protein
MLYHYSYVFPKQAEQKVGYYSTVEWTTAFRENARWYQESYLNLKRPMFLGERGWPELQWLEQFNGRHPKAIQNLINDLASGQLKEELRATQDIRRILGSPVYKVQRSLASLGLAVYWPIRSLWKRMRATIFGRAGA